MYSVQHVCIRYPVYNHLHVGQNYTMSVCFLWAWCDSDMFAPHSCNTG